MRSNERFNGIALAKRWFAAVSVVGILMPAYAMAAELVKQDFSGVVTEAPSGNPFGVSAGSAISGFVTYEPISIGAKSAEVLAVGLTFRLGGITYVCSLANPCKNDAGPRNPYVRATLSLDATGQLLGINAVLRQPGAVDMPLMIAGGQFFAATVPLCLTNAVCGALNLAASKRAASAPLGVSSDARSATR